MDFLKILESKDYDFLRCNPKIKDKILFLTVGGSYAYGTNIETSDLDIRGVILEDLTDSLGLTDFEQFIDTKTDTVLYTLKKFLKLVKECNPNIIEMLYSKEEHYFYVSDKGKVLLQNRDLFLTKRALYSFGGYANSQLNKVLNALARDTLSEKEKLEHINRSVENACLCFEAKHKLTKDQINTYIGKNDDKNEIVVDINLKNYPLSKLKSMVDEMNNVLKSYHQTVTQISKKDDLHINKHMMHLVRLYLMAIEILEYNTCHTYQDVNHELLMDIRCGKYRNEDGSIKEEFVTLVNNLKQKCDKLRVETKLLNYVDDDKFKSLVVKLHERN